MNRFEAGQDARVSSLRNLQQALEAAGIQFIPENGGGAGLPMREPGEKACRPICYPSWNASKDAQHALLDEVAAVDILPSDGQLHQIARLENAIAAAAALVEERQERA